MRTIRVLTIHQDTNISDLTQKTGRTDHMRLKNLGFLALLFLVVTGCRKDPKPLPSEITNIEANPNSVLTGLYLLNEGNMNMNKASLDYLDLKTGTYMLNIYNQINPEVTKGLGDVANDIGLYGSMLYVVVNNSNKVEVLNAKTGKRIAQIDITNCRYITFSAGKAYVSAYLVGVGNSNSGNGSVIEIDTNSLKITRTAEVGRQPEELAVVNQKLYVANSGGYSPPNYESTISVIDLTNFIEVKRIEVGINLNRLKADKYGDLYVTSRGDYYATPSKLVVISTQTESVKKTFDLTVSNLTIDGDFAYLYATSWNYLTSKNTISYQLINVKEEILLPQQFINDGTAKSIELPYGIAVNPYSKDVYVTDAKDYVTPGKLHCYSPAGKLKWSVTTGDVPAHIVFVN